LDLQWVEHSGVLCETSIDEVKIVSRKHRGPFMNFVRLAGSLWSTGRVDQRWLARAGGKKTAMRWSGCCHTQDTTISMSWRAPKRRTGFLEID
jgi:hypothetical protein